MTSEQIKQWKQSRDIARGIADPESRRIALEKVYDQRDDLQMECIQHQADRIKLCLKRSETTEIDISNIKADLSNIKDEMKPLKKTSAEFTTMKERGKGAIWGARVCLAVGSVVGFEAVKGLLSALQSFVK